MLLFYRSVPVSGRPRRSPAPTLHNPSRTLYLLLLLVEHLEVLLESLLCLLTLRIVLLQVLAEIYEVDLDLEIPLADVLLLRLEVLLVSEWGMGYFLNSSFWTSKA